MKGHPPHLPPESCRVDTHYRLRSLRWTVFLILISFLSGTAAALSVSAWITPAQVASIGYRQNAVGNGKDSLFQSTDPEFVRQTEQKIITVFDRRKKTNKLFYTDKALVGKAAMLSSDGWAGIFYPAYIVGEEKNWEAVDDKNLYYSFEKTAYDKVANLLYVKIKGAGFRISSFADSRNLTSGQGLWAVGKDGWRRVSLGELALVESKTATPIWRPTRYFSLSSETTDGALLFNDSGELIGAVDTGQVVPAWLISGQIGSLLEKNKVKYNLVNWKGWMVNGVEREGKKKNLNGFYVSEASGSAANKAVKVGDVIIKINGDAVLEQTLTEKIFIAPDEFKVTVWRNGEEIEAAVNKEIVKP